MPKPPEFDLAEAHKYFSAHCFNTAWDFIDKESRTEEETERMIQTCLASLWHWSQREDATPQNYSVGYWQASRAFALAGKPDDARRYAGMSLAQSGDLDPFFLGYAYEALARSEMVAGNHEAMTAHLQKARELCEKVDDKDSRGMLEADLETIK